MNAKKRIAADLGLPDGDGIDLAGRLRATTQAPIIVISAQGREADKVAALDLGADDYLTKPFGVEELLARMRVALRHARRGAGASPDPDAWATRNPSSRGRRGTPLGPTTRPRIPQAARRQRSRSRERGARNAPLAPGECQR